MFGTGWMPEVGRDESPQGLGAEWLPDEMN
jgi:hypothetical protein